MNKQWHAGLKMVMVLALVVLVLPISLVHAITITQPLSVTVADYASGKFGLTGLAQEITVGDVQQSGVQLIPQGIIRQFRQSQKELCRSISQMGTATFGTNIYIVGGTTRSGGNESNVKEVCRTTVTSVGGDTADWTTKASEDLPIKRTALTAVAVPNPTDATRGFLYAIGGRQEGGNTSYVDTIFSAPINPDGSVGTWITQSLTLPAPRGRLSATAYTTENGETFIYVVGGYDRFGSGPISISRDVLRTKVGNDGTLAAWETMPGVPIPADALPTNGCEDKVGIYNTDVVNMDAVTLDGTYRAFVVMGGFLELGGLDVSGTCNTASAPSPYVFLGKLDIFTGVLTWEVQRYTLPEPVSQIRAVGINQKIYAAGGVIGSGASASPTNKVFSSFINIDSFSLPLLGSSNFFTSDSAIPAASARAAHGLVTVTFGTRPLVYMFGGVSATGTLLRDVLYGFVGTDDDISANGGGYANPGLYVSPFYQLRASASVEQLLWTAAISTTGAITTDIQMQYRMAPNREAVNSATWITVDGDPNSNYSSTLGESAGAGDPAVQGLWMQYRALLRTNTPSSKEASPVLRNVRVRYKIEGHPNLFVSDASFPVVQAGVINPTVTIQNNIPATSPNQTEQLLDAAIESDGTLYVDMYVFPPGTPANLILTPTMQPDGGWYEAGTAFAEISKASLPADGTLQVPPTLWRRTCYDQNGNLGDSNICPAPNWQLIFNQVGTWTVIIIVDSGNNLEEADGYTDPVAHAWEFDNAYRFTVESQVNGSTVYLPNLFREAIPGN